MYIKLAKATNLIRILGHRLRCADLCEMGQRGQRRLRRPSSLLKPQCKLRVLLTTQQPSTAAVMMMVMRGRRRRWLRRQRQVVVVRVVVAAFSVCSFLLQRLFFQLFCSHFKIRYTKLKLNQIYLNLLSGVIRLMLLAPTFKYIVFIYTSISLFN